MKPNECTSVYLAHYMATAALHDLHLAIRTKRQDLVIHVLKTNPTLNVNSNLLKTTALSLAVQQKSEPIFELLLNHGCNLDKLSSDPSGRLETPLYTACRLKLTKIVGILLKNGANPNLTDFDHHTPLWVAVKERALEIVRLLIDAGANLNAADKCGQTPLHLACKYTSGREDIAKLLIAHGAYLHMADYKGRTCLDYAEYSQNIEISGALLRSGAMPSVEMWTRIRALIGTREFQTADNCLKFIFEHMRKVRPLQTYAIGRIRDHLRQCDAQSIWSRVDQLDFLPPNLKTQMKVV